MDIIRKELASNELSPANLRYDPTCNCVQQSYDGGSTWVDNPGADPRHVDAFRLPVRTGGDPQCDAAANMTAYVKQAVDGFVARAGAAAQITGLLGDFLVFFLDVGVLIEAIVELIADLEFITAAVVDAAMTSTIYDELNCIFYCGISADGSVSAAQFAAILNLISVRLSGVPNDVLSILLNVWGEVGLSNAGAFGGETGSCGGCDCSFCHIVDFSVSNGSADGVVLIGGQGTYVPGSGWIGKLKSSPNNLIEVQVRWLFGRSVNVLEIGSTFDKGGGSGAANVNKNSLYQAGAPNILVETDATNPIGNNQAKSKATNVNADFFDLDINTGTGAFAVTLRSMMIRYNAASAIWSENC